MLRRQPHKMTYILSDVFVGNFGLTQGFGSNPQSYAKFGLKGHNGLDFACPASTQIISTASGKVIEVGSDSGGYGIYVKVLHSGFFTIYAHFKSTAVKVGDSVVRHQLLGYSDNTGNSTGNHLHFGVAPCDSNGTKTEKANGYGGYIDPNGSRCKWDIKNPNSPAQSKPDTTFVDLVTKSTNWDVTADYLAVERLDVKGGEKAVEKIKEIEKQYVDANKKISELEVEIAKLKEPPAPPPPTPEPPTDGGVSTGNNWLEDLLDALKKLFPKNN